MFNPYEYPEVKNIYGEMLNSLFEESGRGAVLIATTHVEDFLRQLIDEALPEHYSKEQRDELFNYPGPFHSLASKIGNAYKYEFIGERLYKCLEELRAIRNEAGHSKDKFDLYLLNEKMNTVYDIGELVPNFVYNVSVKMMLDLKFNAIKELFNRNNLNQLEQKELIKEILKDKKLINEMERQVPFWQLANGISLICGTIRYQKEKIVVKEQHLENWNKVIKNKK